MRLRRRRAALPGRPGRAATRSSAALVVRPAPTASAVLATGSTACSESGSGGSSRSRCRSPTDLQRTAGRKDQVPVEHPRARSGPDACAGSRGASSRRASGRTAARSSAWRTTLDHRGPDDRGIEVHENVGLVTTRLAIVDPGPAGHQPMWDALGALARRLQRRGLQPPRAARRAASRAVARAQRHRDAGRRPGRVGRAASSSAATARWPSLRSTVERGRLLLARDRFGKKPLYVARHHGGLWFASEIKALLAAGVPARPRRDVLAHTAVRGWACGRATPLEGVDRVAAGDACVAVGLDALDVSERRWYDPARVGRSRAGARAGSRSRASS